MRPSLVSRVAFWLLLALTVFLYAYALIAAIGNIFGVQEIAAALEVGFTPLGILWIGFSVGLPIIVFILALTLGLKKTKWQRFLLLALGLAVVSIWQLNMLHFVPVTGIIA